MKGKNGALCTGRGSAALRGGRMSRPLPCPCPPIALSTSTAWWLTCTHWILPSSSDTMHHQNSTGSSFERQHVCSVSAGCRRLKDYHTTDERNEHNTDPMYDFLTSQIAFLAICGVLILCDTSQIWIFDKTHLCHRGGHIIDLGIRWPFVIKLWSFWKTLSVSCSFPVYLDFFKINYCIFEECNFHSMWTWSVL